MSRAAGNIVARANSLFSPRQVLQSSRCFSSGFAAAEANRGLQKERLVPVVGRVLESCTKKSCWVPDPRTGIYFPVGQEVVMQDVPENAARLSHNVWVRTVDGV
ncbi:hypothetical protein LINGRAHAP2_LOCUS35700 [Linum grandiflorum]